MTPWYPPTQQPREPGRPEVKHAPRQCRLRGMPVWAILTNANGEWRIVNCLDKEPACEPHRCALVTSGGIWPFEEPLEEH